MGNILINVSLESVSAGCYFFPVRSVEHIEWYEITKSE